MPIPKRLGFEKIIQSKMSAVSKIQSLPKLESEIPIDENVVTITRPYTRICIDEEGRVIELD